MKEEGRDLNTKSLRRQTLAPVSNKPLILQEERETRSEGGVGGFAVTNNSDEACENEIDFLAYLEGVKILLGTHELFVCQPNSLTVYFLY